MTAWNKPEFVIVLYLGYFWQVLYDQILNPQSLWSYNTFKKNQSNAFFKIIPKLVLKTVIGDYGFNFKLKAVVTNYGFDEFTLAWAYLKKNLLN